jgi:hypothetical protein
VGCVQQFFRGISGDSVPVLGKQRQVSSFPPLVARKKKGKEGERERKREKGREGGRERGRKEERKEGN